MFYQISYFLCDPKKVLLGLPGVSANDVQRFEEKLLNSSQNPNMKNSKVEKMKKDVFKKLVIEVCIKVTMENTS